MSDKDLLTILEEHFGRPKIKGNYAYICSPFNPDDKNPSCSVMLKDTDKFSEGFFKDFSTGKSGNIYALLGIPHDFKARTKHRKLAELASPVEAKFHMSKFEYSPSKYLYSRGISYDVQARFKVHEFSDRVSMPVFDSDGYFLYDVSRMIKEKRYANSAPTDAYPALTHELSISDLVFVCESMIDAYTFYTVGFKAIALNSAGNHSRLKELFKDHFGRIVLALDPDRAGRLNAAEIMQELYGKDVVDLVLPFDVNECWTRMLSELNFDDAVVKFKEFILRQVEKCR